MWTSARSCLHRHWHQRGSSTCSEWSYSSLSLSHKHTDEDGQFLSSRESSYDQVEESLGPQRVAGCLEWRVWCSRDGDYALFTLECSSEEWNNVPDREKRKMGLVVADDGEFWWELHYLKSSLFSFYRMEFEDCVQWFTNITICRLLDRRWSLHEAVFHGAWEGLSAGGCSNFKATFRNNPQV